MATLQYHLDNCRAVFGDDSRATKFLEQKIQESGADTEVLAPESQVIMLCQALHADRGVGNFTLELR